MRIKNAKKKPKVRYDNTEMWNSQNLLISEKDCLYVYTDYGRIEREDGSIETIRAIKKGDGTSYLIDMPFLVVGDESSIRLYIQQAALGNDTVPFSFQYKMDVEGESLVFCFK